LDGKHRYQDSWILKYHWALQDLFGTDNFEKVKCIMCSRVEVTMFFWMQKMTICPSTRGGWFLNAIDQRLTRKKWEEKDDSWWNNDCKYKKNERIYLSLCVANIQTRVAQGALPKRKEVQMVVTFYLLSFGQPMVEYKCMEGLFKHSSIPKVRMKYWIDTSGWEMVESLYNVVYNKTN